MSKDDKLCFHLSNSFNNDLRRYGYERFMKHEEFTKIQWRDVEFSFQSRGRTEKGEAKGVLLDIDNNGTEDFVVKWSPSVSGVMRDEIYVLGADAALRSHQLSNQELFSSANRIDSGWVYSLQPPFEAQAVSFGILEPFVFDERVYLYMRPLFEITSPIPSQFSIVARYNGGIVDRTSHTNVFSDVCYFQRTRTTRKPG